MLVGIYKKGSGKSRRVYKDEEGLFYRKHRKGSRKSIKQGIKANDPHFHKATNSMVAKLLRLDANSRKAGVNASTYANTYMMPAQGQRGSRGKPFTSLKSAARELRRSSRITPQSRAYLKHAPLNVLARDANKKSDSLGPLLRGKNKGKYQLNKGVDAFKVYYEKEDQIKPAYF